MFRPWLERRSAGLTAPARVYSSPSVRCWTQRSLYGRQHWRRELFVTCAAEQSGVSHMTSRSVANVAGRPCAGWSGLYGKNLVAVERSARGCHHDGAGGRAGRHRGLDFVFRDHRKRRRGAVERDAGCAGQIGSENLDGCAHLPGGGLGFDKRAETRGQFEDRAAAAA